MYTTIVCFLFTFYIFYIVGHRSIYFFDKNSNTNYNFADCFFIGLCVTGCILNVYSLFLPTNFIAFIILLIIVLCTTYKYKHIYQKKIKSCYGFLKTNRLLTFSLFTATIIILFFAIILPKNYDSYLYHINAIQWIENYRIVPGLANLHDRFGLNSTLFVLSAAFSFTAIFNQYFFVINSLSFLVFTIWTIKEVFAKKEIIGLFLLLFLFYFIKQYGSEISSPGTDLLPNILVSYILINLMINDKSILKKFLLFIFLTFFCLTLKLSTFPILTVGIIALYCKFKKKLIVLKYIFIFGSFIIVPWLVRNVILTGYVFYPLENFDLFDFDWEVSKQSVMDIKNSIYSWGRVPFVSSEKVLNMQFIDWFEIWWGNSLIKNKCFYILSINSPVFVIIYYLVYNKENNKFFLFSFIISYVSLLFWFFTAPDVRFSFAFILILALSPILFLKFLNNHFKKVFNPILFIFLVYINYSVATDGYLLFKDDYQSIFKISKYAYLPKDVYFVKYKLGANFTEKFLFNKNGLKIKIFEPKVIGTQCYDQFPCTWNLNQNVKLRGTTLQEGFNLK